MSFKILLLAPDADEKRSVNRLEYRLSERQLTRLVEISADLEAAGVALIAPAWPTATFGLATKLLIADHRQHWPQPLILGDGTLVDVPILSKVR